ncbi:MAG: hypothetical protein Q8O67_26205 [Deltaproteobacteria bacterium]|nr:hypothetical protein [Deltaproteobacteria bacterium]
MSPAPVLDDEHQQTTLERRLDAAILAAGATPPHGLRSPSFGGSADRAPDLLARRSTFDHPNDHRPRASDLVPLRLDPPARPSDVVVVGADEVTQADRQADRFGPRAPSPDRFSQHTPKVLQFLRDDMRSNDDSVSRIPRLEPVRDSTLIVAVGVHTNVYRLRSSEEEETPARPLPAFAASVDEEADTAQRNRKDKVATHKSAEGFGIALRSFSSDDFVDDDDDTHEGPPLAQTDGSGERLGRAVAAVALPALSDEGFGIDEPADLGSMDDLDELARQLGMHGAAIPRSARVDRVDSVDSEEDLDEVSGDDIELVAVASPTDPFAAVVMGRAATPELDDDDDYNDDLEVTAPRAIPGAPLPASLFRNDVDDDDDETPARGSLRPAIVAPQAVRFIVSAAPARPRHEALSAEEKARNCLRAHDLYLVAMDDLGDGDPEGALVHLELAIAYDDETALYRDLLEQLKKKNKQ